MPRVEIWSGPIALAKKIEQAIHRWDEDGEVAKNLLVSPTKDGDAILVATFDTDEDGKDAAAFADGYGDGFLDGLDHDEDEDDPDEDEDDPDPDDEEDEDE